MSCKLVSSKVFWEPWKPVTTLENLLLNSRFITTYFLKIFCPTTESSRERNCVYCPLRISVLSVSTFITNAAFRRNAFWDGSRILFLWNIPKYVHWVFFHEKIQIYALYCRFNSFLNQHFSTDSSTWAKCMWASSLRSNITRWMPPHPAG